MSGYKLAAISITSADYDRLYEAHKEVAALPEPDVSQMAYLGQQSTEILRTSLEGMQSRQEAFEAMLSTASRSISEIERNTSQALLDFEADVLSQTEGNIGTMWLHFDQVLADYANQFDREIKKQYVETQQHIADLYSNVRQMAVNANEKQQMAEEWLEAASLYCSYIKQYFYFEAFAPGQIEGLERQLDQARINLESGLTEAVIASAQQLVLAFSDLRVELERAQNEWVFLFQAAWEAINQLLMQIDACQLVEAVDLEGNLLPSRIEVDYWCAGALRQLYDRVLSLRIQMEDGQHQPDREMLQSMLEVDVPMVRGELDEIIFQARVNVLNSQLRINIADLVVRALQEQGFALEGSDYVQNDMRLGYGAQLENIEGNQVIVQVAPVGERIGENELHLQSLDQEERTEHELELRWYEISRSLHFYGIDVGNYTRLDPVRRKRSLSPVTSGYRVKQSTSHSAGKISNSYGYRTGPADPAER